MKKIDNQGFVMVETIVVAVFVIGICTFLFTNFLPLIADYERVSEYDNVDTKYKAHEIRKMLLREFDKDANLTSIFSSHISSNTGYYRYQNYSEEVGDEVVVKNRLCSLLTSPNYCNKLLSTDYLNVKEIIVTPFKLSNFKGIVKDNQDFERSLREYVEYLPDYSKYSNRYDSYYRIIVAFNDERFSNIEVHYDLG